MTNTTTCADCGRKITAAEERFTFEQGLLGRFLEAWLCLECHFAEIENDRYIAEAYPGLNFDLDAPDAENWISCEAGDCQSPAVHLNYETGTGETFDLCAAHCAEVGEVDYYFAVRAEIDGGTARPSFA